MKMTTALGLALLLASSALAGDWAQFRGPNFNGSTDETGLPVKFSRTENVAWSVNLPGPSGATPIVHGDNVFVSSTDPEKDALWAMCFERTSGKLLWKHEVGEGVRKDTRSTFAGPTPATDGKVVVFFYGNGDLYTYDMQGKELWHKNIGPFAFGWTFSTSPVLYDGKLYMQILQNKSRNTKSYILALDPQTGKELWRHIRPSGAVAESLEAFTTPTPYVHNGQAQLLVNGGDAATGHDLDTGKELWRWETWNPEKIGHWRLVPSPVAGEGVVLVCAPKRSPIYAIPTAKSGQLKDNQLYWVSKKQQRNLTSDVPTPAYYDGDFFILSKSQHHVSRVKPKSGEVVWEAKLPSRKQLEASPLAADGKIYTLDFDGVATVISTDNGEILHTAAMAGEDELGEHLVRSSIVAAHGNLFIRTNTKLYCIGQQ